MFAMFILAAVLLISAWTDLQQRLIYNAVTYPAAVTGLVLNAYHSWIGNPASQSVLFSLFPGGWLGGIGFWQSLTGGLSCFLLLLLAYSGGGAGGGDVKLAGVLGLFLGLPWAIYVLMLTFLIAAAAILPLRIWKSGWAGLWTPTLESNKSVDQVRSSAVPLGVFYAAAFFLFFGVNRWS